jgi:phospholipid/cholesterol/gamma-HCH transport system substrate-binding protein
MPSAARVHWAKFRVSIVTLCALAILATLCYLLAGEFLFQPAATLYLYAPDATGLAPKSPVRVDGVGIGNVDSVVLSGLRDPARVVRVVMTIRRDRLKSLPADSFAQISSENIVGDKFVDITSGASDQPFSARNELAFKNSPELLKSLDLTQFTDQLRQIDATLARLQEGRTPFGRFVLSTGFYNGLLLRLRQLHTGFHQAVAPTTTVGALLSSDRLHRQVADTLENIDRSVARIQSGQDSAGRFLRDPASYDQAVAELRDLRRSLANVRAGSFFQSDAAYIAWTRQLSAWIRSVDDLNTQGVLTGTGTYEQLDGAVRQLGQSLREFRENPKRYLRVKLF